MSSPSPGRGHLPWVGTVLLLMGLLQPPGWAAEPSTGTAPTVDPREFGFAVPAGAVTIPERSIVLTKDEFNRPANGRVYAQIGESHHIVLLPDGQLVARTIEAAPPTDRPFVPLTGEELQKELAAGPFRGFRTDRSKHHIFFSRASEPFTVHARRILETMVPGMVQFGKNLGVKVTWPEFPLVAILFRTREEFQSFRRMPPGVVAYYDVASNYVVMYEESDLYRIRADLGLQESVSTIAHEGAHQILHNIGVQQRLSRWPMWLGEGLAEFMAPTTYGKNLKWKGPGKPNDLRMFNLELYLKGREANTPSGQMISDTVSGARLSSTGYATAWSLTHFLIRSQRDAFNAYVRELSELPPFGGEQRIVAPGVIPANLERFKTYFGEDLTKLETGLIRHLRTVEYTDPFRDWPHYVAVLELPAGTKRQRRQANLFHSPAMARKWVQEVIEELPGPQQAQARSEVREFANRLLADLFARQYLGLTR